MNIIITYTPELSAELIHSVANILTLENSEFNFNVGTPINLEDVRDLDSNYSIDQGEVLSFDKLFYMCRFFRGVYKTPKSDIVVILTSHLNDQHWFSATEDKNIFVCTEDWEVFTKRDAKYGVAYQVIENVFQSLIGDSHNIQKDSATVHMDPIGCINDFCMNKELIINKLKTADICEDCLKAAQSNGVSNNTLLSFQNVLQNLQRTFRSFNIEPLIEPQNVSIDEKGNITIGNKTIKLEPLQKTLFIFFLKNLQGIELNYLDNYEEDLYQIYFKLKRYAQRDKIKSLVLSYVDNSSFSTTKSSLNRSLKESTGAVSRFYTIEKVGTLFKIALPSNYLQDSF